MLTRVLEDDIMMSVMRTTLSIDDDLLARLREEANRRKRPLRAVVNDALRMGLARLSEAGDSPRFRVGAFPLGLKPGFQGTSLNQLYDQIEAEAVDPSSK